MLADGFNTRRGRRGALIHHDAVNRQLRGRRGARLTALTAGGTIPDNADYRVLLEPENNVIGSVNEDFAVESLAGDVFQLGNRSYKIQRVERGTVRVEDAQGQPPNIPFWLGEAPGRSDELSASVSRLRAEIERRLRLDPSGESTLHWLTEELALDCRRGRAAGRLPARGLRRARLPADARDDRARTLLRRGGRHAAGGAFALRQPAQPGVGPGAAQALLRASSISSSRRRRPKTTSSSRSPRRIASRWPTCRATCIPTSRRGVLIQAVLDSPMFTTRWRWVSGVSLALPRFRGGHKVPPQLARMAAEDLLGSVFPDQIACAENLPGDREIPDHPLVQQAIDDCLNEAMDIEGLETLLRRHRVRRRSRSSRAI